MLVKLSALGDVVHSLPVLMAIRQQAPQSVIHWLAEETAADLLVGHPALDRLWLSPRRSWRHGLVSGTQTTLKFWKEFRKESYDVVLDLQGLIKSAIFVFLSRGVRKIGFGDEKEPAEWALNEVLPAYDLERHALERYLDLLMPLGLTRPQVPLYGLEPSLDSLDYVRQNLGVKGDAPLLILHPMALWDSKLWPSEHWEVLARTLRNKGCQVVFSGAQADQPLISRLAAASGTLDMAGKTNLQQLIALYSLADLVVSTDTGTMHLAAALQKPVVALFGPTAPWRTGPYGSGHRVLRIGAPCSPCFMRKCPDPYCLGNIEPDQVVEAVNQMLGEQHSAPVTR